MLSVFGVRGPMIEGGADVTLGSEQVIDWIITSRVYS